MYCIPHIKRVIFSRGVCCANEFEHFYYLSKDGSIYRIRTYSYTPDFTMRHKSKKFDLNGFLSKKNVTKNVLDVRTSAYIK